MSGWLSARPDPARYRPSRGLTSAQRAAEQDAAAGGRERRRVRRVDGPIVVASVALRLPSRSRRVYAYLRWTGPNRVTYERYLGDVSETDNREAALRMAWSVAHGERDATTASGSRTRGEVA
jgi:DNA mismatch endonuclease (patch repair protein)